MLMQAVILARSRPLHLASCLQVTVIRDGGVLPLPLREFLSKVDEIRLSANFNAHCMLVTHQKSCCVQFHLLVND